MLTAINIISQIAGFLDNETKEGKVLDYRIALKLNMDVNVFVLIRERNKIDYSTWNSFESIKIEEITEEDCEQDSFYENIFSVASNDKKIDFGLRRRLTNLIDGNIKIKIENKTPVVTFYSYKGGMGRSTTLASFASHYAYHYKKKIVILDCDFEAPGFTNFFDLTDELLSQRNGVVEYLLDKEFLKEKIELQNYYFEIKKEYTGEGEIYVMPAGNLSDSPASNKNSNSDTHRDHYLEGLARIDISSSSYIIEQFIDLFSDINKKIKPDLILLDSRTGFNDIFGLMAFHLSTIVIGFFGNNIQTNPGLHFLIDTISLKKNIPLILVNSIISSGKFFEDFVKEVNTYVDSNLSDEEAPIFEIYPIYRDPILEKIGTKDEFKTDFINLIKNQSYSYYKDLFLAIANAIENHKTIELENNTPPIVVSEKDISTPITHQADESKPLSPLQILSLKKKILKAFKENSPNLYAKDTILTDDFLNKKFYFRRSMEDIFNRDLFLIIGNKGTGKTFLYNALKGKSFIQRLKEKAKKNEEDFVFINIISIKDEKNPQKLLPVSNNFNINSLTSSDFFFNRFWIVYTWNSIMLNSKEQLGFISKLDPRPFKNDTSTADFVLQKITSDDSIIKIEKELKELDDYLKSEKRSLVVLFDELDFIVKPSLWDKGIAPLINYWRTNPYSRIYPKLFIRSDLFEKLGNVNNKQDLKAQSISFEWDQEELFSFFFKLILANSELDFFNIMQSYGDFSNEQIKKIKSSIGADYQVPLEKEYLKPLVDTFFGKWADQRDMKSTSYGESYDWFYRNLKNADYTISLRPFIDLINQAINQYLSNTNYDGKIKPILSSWYYSNATSRLNAVQNHFRDLADEEGNGDLTKIFEYIRVHAPLALRKLTLPKNEFEALLDGVLRKYGTSLDNKTVDALRDLLIVNGIIYQLSKPGGFSMYHFALLYKYYLGLAAHRSTRRFYR